MTVELVGAKESWHLEASRTALKEKEERGPTRGKRGNDWAPLRICPVKAGKQELLLFAGHSRESRVSVYFLP